MIYILGSKDGPEFDATQKIKSLICEAWPWIEDDSNSNIWLIAGVKCHGQAVSDIDIVIFGLFSSNISFRPFLPFTSRDGSKEIPEEIFVKSLCLVIEVKDHDPSSLRFTGSRVDVRYFHNGRESWHSATDQNERQKYSLIRYLEYNSKVIPRITNLIWLRNVKNIDLPKRPHNIIGGNATWELFLNVLAQMSPPFLRGGKWTINAWPSGQTGTVKDTIDVLIKSIQPTRLDRIKMDQICRAAVNNQWVYDLGSKQIIFRGRGGTGKTITLLQLAWKAFEEKNARVLILTYNKALVADLRRLFSLLGLPDDIGINTIQIQTVHSFLYSALRGLGLISLEEDFIVNFEELKAEALDFLQKGAITQSDIDSLLKDRTDAFSWDYIFIDEGQDWPENERDLLRFLYPANTFTVADGTDQFVRSGVHCNWHEDLPAGTYKTINLKTCLRMKAGLAKFVTQFAVAMGLAGWEAIPNNDAPGGRVIIFEGDYFSDEEVHNRLVLENEQDGNQLIDMLVCVPPRLVVHNIHNVEISSVPAKVFTNWGHKVWDGVSLNVRASYPTSTQQLRIVQYDSCRGLEGWVVINLGLDEFYEYKKSTWQPSPKMKTELLTDDPLSAHRYAVRWLMISLTRAIDTLVIQVSKRDSCVRSALVKVAESCKDFIEWHNK